MNRFAVVALLLGVGASAHASSERFYRMYDVPTATLEKRALEAASKVASDCNYSMMSRIGPRPAEMARCNAAEEKLVAQGTSGARAVLAMLDDENLGHGARARMYDALARIGDLSVIEPLVQGLEREEAAGLGNPRQYERNSIVRALDQLAYTELKGTPAIQWRAWLDKHRGISRVALLQERADEVEREVASGGVDDVMQGARVLASHQATQDRARKILGGLLARADLSADQQRTARNLLDELPRTAAQVKPSVTAQQQALPPRS